MSLNVVQRPHKDITDYFLQRPNKHITDYFLQRPNKHITDYFLQRPNKHITDYYLQGLILFISEQIWEHVSNGKLTATMSTPEYPRHVTDVIIAYTTFSSLL